MQAHKCRYTTLDGKKLLSGKEFILANQQQFQSLSMARKSLNLVKFHIWLLNNQYESELEHFDNYEKYLDISITNTRWYYVVFKFDYYFYKVVKY